MNLHFHRREALKAMAVGATAVASQQLLQAAEPSPVKGHIKQSVCRWCYSKIPLDRLTAEAAATLLPKDPQRARASLDEVRALAAQATEELGQVVAELGLSVQVATEADRVGEEVLRFLQQRVRGHGAWYAHGRAGSEGGAARRRGRG